MFDWAKKLLDIVRGAHIWDRITGKGSGGPLSLASVGPIPATWVRYHGARPEPRGAPANTLLALSGYELFAPEDFDALFDTCDALGIPADSLWTVIHHESMGHAAALNAEPAAGLIQLTTYAKLPGFETADKIRSIIYQTASEQLRGIVRQHYARSESIVRGMSPGELLLFNFVPKFVGRTESTVIASRGEPIYDKNFRGFDVDAKGSITVADVYRAAERVTAEAGGRRVTRDGKILPSVSSGAPTAGPPNAGPPDTGPATLPAAAPVLPAAPKSRSAVPASTGTRPPASVAPPATRRPPASRAPAPAPATAPPPAAAAPAARRPPAPAPMPAPRRPASPAPSMSSLLAIPGMFGMPGAASGPTTSAGAAPAADAVSSLFDAAGPSQASSQASPDAGTPADMLSPSTLVSGPLGNREPPRQMDISGGGSGTPDTSIAGSDGSATRALDPVLTSDDESGGAAGGDSAGGGSAGGSVLDDAVSLLSTGGPALGPDSDTQGLLLAAAQAHVLDPVGWTWVPLPDDDLEVFVPNDAFSTALGDTAHVRIPVSYADLREVCRLLGCVPATKAIVDAIYQYAQVHPKPVGLVQKPGDDKKMNTVGFVLTYHAQLEKQLQDAAGGMGLTTLGSDVGVEPAGKWWIIDPKLAKSKYGPNAAVNYGWFRTSVNDPIQTPGGAHNDAHSDYSQVARAVHRYARRASTHEQVDLCDVYAEKWPELASFIDVFR